jgi:inorganic phosphate transporter, PiT family
MPISTTHTLVGAVIGVGFARGIAALNLGVIRNIVNSWLATVPVSAGLAAILFVIVRVFAT